MTRIYIAGCGGMLGDAFYNRFKEDFALKCTDIDVNEEWLTYLDFRDFDKYRHDVQEFRTDYLFHLGAYTDLEYCEDHPEDAYITNTIAVENAVRIANELKIPILYISTAGIFDGNKELYDDWDVPNPLGHYARSKYAGEMYVRENAKTFLICRPGWMMGGGPRKDKKFIQKIMRQLRDGKKKLFVVNDKFGTPTYTHDFALNVKLLVDNNEDGIYNMVCGGFTDRLEVAREILHLQGLTQTVEIEEVTSEHFKAEYYANRPACERLTNRRLNLKKLNIMRDWKTALAEYFHQSYKGYLGPITVQHGNTQFAQG